MYDQKAENTFIQSKLNPKSTLKDVVVSFDKIKEAEIKTLCCATLCLKDLSFNVLDDLSDLFNNIFDDSWTGKNFSCKKTKATSIVKKVLGEAIFEDLLTILKKSKNIKITNLIILIKQSI